MIINDVVLGNVHYLEESNIGKQLYFFRIAAAHFREALEFISSSNSLPEIRTFVDMLDSNIREDYRVVMNWGNAGPVFFRQRLATLRGATFHYPRIGGQEIIAVLNETADQEAGLIVNGPLGNMRAEYADIFANNLSLSNFHDNQQEQAEFMRELANGITAFNRFAVAAIDEYFGGLPTGVVTSTNNP